MTDANLNQEAPAEIELPASPDAAFAQLMDFLAPEEESEAAGAGAGTDGAAAAGAGQAAAAGEGTAAAAGAAGTPAAGAAGGAAVPPAAGAAAAGTEAGAAAGTAATGGEADGSAGAATLDATTLEPEWGKVLTGLETKQNTELQQEAYQEVRGELGKYFDALEQAPRSLVGQSVPVVGGKEGEMEVLKDSADARDWQEGIKQELVKEIRDRASRKADDVRPMMETLTSSVALFQNNPDLIPRTKQFDKELADAFIKMASPYALKVNEKLVGFSIPVQGLLDGLRADLLQRRTAAGAVTDANGAAGGGAAAAGGATPTAAQARAAEQARTAQGQFTNTDAPQAGIPNKAGSSAEEAEDFSTFFGTIGLPNLRI